MLKSEPRFSRKSAGPDARLNQPEAAGENRLQEGMVRSVVAFADFLRSRGFSVFQSSIQDTLQGLSVIDIVSRKDFFHTLRAALVTSDLEWSQFEGLFEYFWGQGRILHEEPPPVMEPQEIYDSRLPEQESCLDPSFGPEIRGEEEKRCWLEGISYSPVSDIEQKDLASFDSSDVQVARLILKRLIALFRNHSFRRSKKSKRAGDIDFFLTMRKSLRTGGIPARLYFRRKKKRLRRLVVIADVSGSMDRYSGFVVPFLLGIRGLGSRSEVFAFSTSLTEVTGIIRGSLPGETLEGLVRKVGDWSGGTRIGYSLDQFVKGYDRLLDRRSVAVIISDGWDLGSRAMLLRSMRILKRGVHSVIWLNPLAGDPDYESLSGGMKRAGAYVDHCLAARNLSDLRRVGRLITNAISE